MFCNCLRSSGRTGIIASEEEDVPVAVEETYSGNYIVVFDPIDGSANIDTALTTGSIFGIYGPDEQCLIDLDDTSTVILSSAMSNLSQQLTFTKLSSNICKYAEELQKRATNHSIANANPFASQILVF